VSYAKAVDLVRDIPGEPANPLPIQSDASGPRKIARTAEGISSCRRAAGRLERFQSAACSGGAAA